MEVGSGSQRVLVRGDLKIGPDLPPGEYALQAVVTDVLADKQDRTAGQYIAFPVAR